MDIGKQDYEVIIVTDLEGGVIAMITDEEIMEAEGFKVILEPTKSSC